MSLASAIRFRSGSSDSSTDRKNGAWFSMRTDPATGALPASPGLVPRVQPPPRRKETGGPATVRTDADERRKARGERSQTEAEFVMEKDETGGCFVFRPTGKGLGTRCLEEEGFGKWFGLRTRPGRSRALLENARVSTGTLQTGLAGGEIGA